MPRRLQIWCDECGATVPLLKLVQWSPVQANGWRLLDFCSYRCAEAFRAKLIADSGRGRGPRP